MNQPLDPDRIQAALDAVHRAGIPAAFAEIRDGDDVFSGASGIADLDTGAPATADMRHRVGSITKTFTAVAVLRQVEQGHIGLDTPIGHYLPHLVPGDRGDAITVRMLIGHTSGLPDYLPHAYPSLAAFPRIADTTPRSLEDHRFTRFDPVDLITLGVKAPATRAPGDRPGVYSNTNYLLLSQLLEKVTGAVAEQHITDDVIAPAGLRDTELATTTHIDGPHPRIYESWFGMFDPPRDFSVFDMSWVGASASAISTVADLNRFFGLLLDGRILRPATLEHMRRTGPVILFEGTTLDYGLGLTRKDVPGRGAFWGHDGSVWGGGAISMTSADGGRQVSLAVTRQRWNPLDANGKPQPHPIDKALADLYALAMS